MTIVTTPRLGREEDEVAGLRDCGRILWPEKSPATLPPTKGEMKLEEREARRDEEEEEEEEGRVEVQLVGLE